METAGGADERKNSGLEELRRVSRKAHDAVDEAFSRFELSDRTSYGAFLTAHARALVVAENYLSQYEPVYVIIAALASAARPVERGPARNGASNARQPA